MKRCVILSAVLILVVSVQSVYAQSAKEALMSLKKLQSKCEAGILYNEYPPSLAETKAQVMDYLQSPLSSDEPEFAEALGSALGHYECAGQVFDYMYKAGAGQHFVSTLDPSLFAKVKQRYPELNIYVNKDISGFSYSEAIQVMWARAASEVERAFDNLPSRAGKTTSGKAVEQADPDDADVTDGRLKQQVNALKHEVRRLKKENKELRREVDRLKGRQ